MLMVPLRAASLLFLLKVVNCLFFLDFFIVSLIFGFLYVRVDVVGGIELIFFFFLAYCFPQLMIRGIMGWRSCNNDLRLLR
jgi:hypothetical protein